MRLFGQEDVLMVEVEDETVVGEGIHAGDTVVVCSSLPAREGDLVAAVMPDSHSPAVGRLRRDGERVELVPEHPERRPISARETDILGRVIGIMRARIH